MTRPPLRPTLAVLLGTLLAACSQTPAPAAGDVLPPGSPYANGAAYPWSDRLEDPVADPYAAGRDYPWSSPQAADGVNAQGLNAGVNHLSDLPWTSATNFWGPVARDRSNGEQDVNDGRPLTIGGVTFAKGLGVHADSTVRYALNAQCSTFTASIGIDDEVGKLGRAAFQVLGDGKVLYTSPELTGTDAARAITVPVAGVRELTLNVLKGTATYYDHADWADAKVTCQALKPSGTVYVSDLAYSSATSGWGPVEIDRSNGEQRQFDGRPLTISRQVFSKGLGVHAGSTLTYDLGGACQGFSATVGVDDETQGRGTVVFQLYGDGRKLYDSGLQSGISSYNSPPLTIARADVSGVQKLQLVVTDGGDGKSFDHADWADAKLVCEPAGGPGSFDPAFGTGGRSAVGGVDSVVEPDGSVVLLGADFGLRRLSPAGDVIKGSPDPVPGGMPYAIARQSNGNLVAVGDLNGAVVVVRYLPTLQPDPSFGAAGVVTAQYGEGTASAAATSGARDVAVQADGKVVVVGTASGIFEPYPGDLSLSSDHLVARLNADGSRDATFGSAGSRVLGTDDFSDAACGQLADIMAAVALQADGRIVAAGNSDCTGVTDSRIFRFLPDGTLDPSFSTDGIATPAPTGNYGDNIRALIVQPDGKVVVGGGTDRFQTSAFVSRLTPGGDADGGAIFQIADNFYEQGTISSLARQADGKIVFGARSPNGLGLGRLNPDFSLDPTFGPLGTGYVPGTTVTSVHIDAAGRIVGSGASETIRVLP